MVAVDAAPVLRLPTCPKTTRRGRTAGSALLERSGVIGARILRLRGRAFRLGRMLRPGYASDASLGPERANLIPTLGVPDDRGLRIGNAGNTHAPTRPGVCSFLRARRASEFGIAKPATYCARFFHTAENEKQLRARDVPTLPCSIGLLSRKLRHSVRNWIVSAASKKTRQFNFIAFSLARISRKPCSVATTRCSAKY